MDIHVSSALDWWDIWKLRLLVLASSVIQVFLFIYGAARRAPVGRCFRLCIWLAYLAGDSVAIYALATLFNQHGRTATVGSTLEVLWAPVLLIHLAGQEQISAYSIEDNELWGRHVVTLVSQVAIALYVFCESWSGERRLLEAAIMMFIIGIYKFSTKPWALKMASFRNLVSPPESVARRKGLIVSSSSRCPWARTPILGTKADMFLADDVLETGELRQARAEQEDKEATEEDLNLGCYLDLAQQARAGKGMREGHAAGGSPLFLAEIEAFVADLLVPYSRRLKILQFMWSIVCKKDKSAFAIRMGLDEIYYRLYTRANAAWTPIGLNVRLLTFSLAVAAIALFAKTERSQSHSHSHHSDGADVKVTYIVFCCTAVLEFLSFWNVYILRLPFVVPPASYRFKDIVCQQSLLSSTALRRSPPLLLRLAGTIGCGDYVNRHWDVKETPASNMIHEAVLAHINRGWGEYIRVDPTRYRMFSDLRGQWALEQRMDPAAATATGDQRLLLDSVVGKPFDESVLLWHVATEICFHHADAAGRSHRKLARVISCYMMYLLAARPEMMMLGTRHHLFSVTLDDIDIMLRVGDLDDDGAVDDHSIGCAIMRAARRDHFVYRDSVGPLIPKACSLAGVLLQRLRLQEKETWEMVQDVWVEMLCYAASRGRGYMHAASHGERWELLSRVWLLLCYMGMETLADRLPRADPPEGNALRPS